MKAKDSQTTIIKITTEVGKSKDLICFQNRIDLTSNLQMRIIKKEKWAFSKRLNQVSVLSIQLLVIKRRQTFLSPTFLIFNTFQNIETRKLVKSFSI